MRIQSLSIALVLVLHSPLASAQWVQTNGLGSAKVSALAVSGANLLAGTDGEGVFLSTNNGTTWSAANSGLTNQNIRAFAVSGSNLFAGTNGGVFASTNNGTSWKVVNSGLLNTYINCLAVIGANLVAGTEGGGIFLSSDNGSNWNPVNSGLTCTSVSCVAVVGTSVLAGTMGSGFFRSTNYCSSWSDLKLAAGGAGLPAIPYATCFAVSPVAGGTDAYAGFYGHGVFRSTNDGRNWSFRSAGLTDWYVYSLAVSGGNVFAGTEHGGVFLSTDNGTNWSAVDSGLTNMNIHALAISGSVLYAGTWGSAVWKRPLSDLITSSVGKGKEVIPSAFVLQQNYPNPFNPSTTITYELPRTSHVSLCVYNTLGQLINVLVDESKPAGVFSAQFDAATLPSGVYFYRLQAGEFTQTKKLVLVR